VRACKQEIPGYVDLQKKYGADGLVVIGVVYDAEPLATIQKSVAENKISYRVALGNDDIENAFGGMDSIPTTFSSTATAYCGTARSVRSPRPNTRSESCAG